MTPIHVLCAMWPNGIPRADYERLLRLLATAPQSSPPPVAPKPRQGARSGDRSLGEANTEALRKLLQDGPPSSTRDLAQRMGKSYDCVHHSLKKLGAVRSVTAPDGSGRPEFLWSLPKYARTKP